MGDLLRSGDLTQRDPKLILIREAVDHLLFGGWRMPQAALHLGIGRTGRNDIAPNAIRRHLQAHRQGKAAQRGFRRAVR